MRDRIASFHLFCFQCQEPYKKNYYYSMLHNANVSYSMFFFGISDFRLDVSRNFVSVSKKKACAGKCE